MDNSGPCRTDCSERAEMEQRIAELEALRDRLTDQIEGETELFGRIAELETITRRQRDAIDELEAEKLWWKETALRQNAGLSPTSYDELQSALGDEDE